MFICNSSWSFHKLIPDKLSFLDFPKKCAELGIHAVELLQNHFLSTNTGYLDQIIYVCKEVKSKIACIALSNDFTIADDSERNKQIDHIKKWLDIAKYLDAPVVRVFTGTKSVRNAAITRAINCFQEVVKKAEELKIKVAIENHWGLSVNPDTLKLIIDTINSPYLGSCIDFGNFQPDDRYYGIELLAPTAFHVHAKSYRFNPDGEEVNIDYKRCINYLKSAGYTGALSIEFEGEEDPIEGTKKTLALIKKYIPNT